MKKLLIIENDINTLDLIESIFEDNKFEVVKSEKIIPINEVIKINPNIIVIDYFLNDGYHGDEMCMEIKSNPLTGQIPVILYSTSSNLVKLAHNSYADAFIPKPFDLDYFLYIVNKFAL